MEDIGYRILIVEDDESIRNLTRMHLKMNGFSNVVAVSDAKEAIEAASRRRPDGLM